MEGSVDCLAITSSTVQEIIDSLKPRKSAGQDKITNEHIMLGTPDLVVDLCLLFTALLRLSLCQAVSSLYHCTYSQRQAW